MTYSPQHVANFMLDRAEKEDREISPMKLLKLVYIGYGWVLAILNTKLFDEPIYAWRHGPVIRSLYDEFKHHRANAIDLPALQFDLDTMEVAIPRIPNDDDETNVVLERVWEIYKHFSAGSLRNKTHERGSPWHQVYNDGERDIVIPDELIQPHFNKKIRQYLENVE